MGCSAIRYLQKARDNSKKQFGPYKRVISFRRDEQGPGGPPPPPSEIFKVTTELRELLR